MARRGGVDALLLCWLLVLGPAPAPAQVRHPLPVLWVMPVSSGPAGGDNLTAAVAPAVQLALQDLKRQPAPLGNYEIQLQLLDSQCAPSQALRALFDAMWAGPRYLLLLGGACPSVTALIGRALPALSLLQVSFAASSPSLSNRKWFGNVFSTAPSDRALNQAAVKLLQRLRWSRVGVVTQEGPRLSEMKKDLLRQLLKADVELVSAESLSSDVCSSLKTLKEKDVRIIIGQFEEDSVSEVFCCAYRLNMFGARYQWLLIDGAAAGWRLGWRPSGCTADSLLTAADGSFRLQTRTISSTNTAGMSGRTPQDYQDAYHRARLQQGSKVSPLHGFAYDAVWVAARALSAAMEAAKHREKYSRNDSVGHEELHRLLLDAVRHTHFQGVTGPVSFRNGERVATIELSQLQGGGGVAVGDFSSASLTLRLLNQRLKFKGPGPARDRVLVLEQRLQVGVLLYGAVSAAAAVTVCAALGLLALTVLQRKRRLRWSSGLQDELLLLSVLLSSSSVLVSGLDGSSLSPLLLERLCSVRLWTLSVGHTVGFTVLLIRTWRIYSLHGNTHTAAGGGGVGVLLGFLLLDVLVLSCWQTLDPLRWEEHSLQSDAADQDVVLRLSSEFCSCSNMELWLSAVFGYKAPLLGFGCFVACGVRPLQLDPRLVLTVFAVAAFSVSGASGSLLTAHNPPVQFCVSSVLLLLCNAFALSFLFGPKLLRLCERGGELQQPAELQDGAAEDSGSRKLNQQLRSLTAQLDVEIETISMQLADAYEPELQLHHQRKSNAGEARAVTWAHAVQICPDNRHSERKPSSLDAINSPELVRRRLSVQLPILHHSYLPAIGGVSASSSSLFASQDDFLSSTPPEPRYL